MELKLYRTYHSKGTNGTLFINGIFICFTIELPFKNNQIGKSCIPEGSYEMVFRNSEKFGKHLLIKNVLNRSFILIHPANDALKELKGCIGPVLKITGLGVGIESKKALKKLINTVEKHIQKNEKLILIIKKGNYEFSGTI